MTSTTLHKTPSRTSRSHAPGGARPLTRAVRHASHDVLEPVSAHSALAHYTDLGGRLREIIALSGHAGSVLVLDRDAITLSDRRLVAHLAADEPAENANLVCCHYLRDSRDCRCRPVNPDDLLTAPFSEGCDQEDSEFAITPPETVALRDRHGHFHRLEALDAGMSIPELRWCRWVGGDELVESGKPQPESVRYAVACLENYEPIRTLTARALARHRETAVSVVVLRAELRRIDASRIVLNRRLRRAVLDAMRTEGLSLSEIAFRCGRIKRDSKGNASGETSWLSRRVGISPESGGGEPTPWIHSEVLALIARCGLGISPREVEL